MKTMSKRSGIIYFALAGVESRGERAGKKAGSDKKVVATPLSSLFAAVSSLKLSAEIVEINDLESSKLESPSAALGAIKSAAATFLSLGNMLRHERRDSEYQLKMS